MIRDLLTVYSLLFVWPAVPSIEGIKGRHGCRGVFGVEGKHQ